MAAGKELKRIRESQSPKVSAKQAASFIGVDYDRYSKWEQRDTDPKDTGDIKKVEDYFNCKLENLDKVLNFTFKKGSGRENGEEATIKRSVEAAQNVRNAAMLMVVLDAQAEILANQKKVTVSQVRSSLEEAVKKREEGLLKELRSL